MIKTVDLSTVFFEEKMLINDILKGYLGLFKLILKILALVIVCTFFGFLIVFPLWKLATGYPTIYSILIVSLSIFFITILIIYSIRKRILNESEEDKKKTIFNYKRSFFLFFLLLVIICLSVFILSIGKTFFGFGILIIGLILYGIVFFVYKKK